MKAVIYTNRRADPILRFAGDFPELEWAITWSADACESEIGDADILILSNRICTPELGAALARARTGSLKWIHSHSAGLERGVNMGLPDNVPVTYSPGAKALGCAEHAITLVLALSRRLWDLREAQRRHLWIRAEINPAIRGLHGATLAIVGLGGIGRDVARKAKAFDARVIGISRGAGGGGNVDQVYPRERMLEALGQADAVVIATSSDASSHHLIGTKALAAMKPTAYVVNVARGEILDQAALAQALKDGKIAGAALDVTDPEPLAPESPLWDMENVIISPHVSAAGFDSYPNLRDIFADNLRRLKAGEPLHNLLEAGATDP